MPKLKYHGLIDGATTKAVHVSHQETLYLELLIPAINALLELGMADETDPLILEIGPAISGRATEELCVLGYVSTFHLWERQFRELIVEQKASQDVDAPPSQRRYESVVAYAKRVMETHFEARGLESYWKDLAQALTVVNAFKHGSGRKFEAALKEYPEYFYVPEDGRHLPIVSIKPKHLRHLIITLIDFWDTVSLTVDRR